MDKRYLRLILLGVVGIIIIAIGIKAITIYGEPIPGWANAQYYLAMRNAEFVAWLITWIIKPLVLFIILTTALIAGLVISNKIKFL